MPTAFIANRAGGGGDQTVRARASWRGLALTLGSLLIITALKLFFYDYIGEATPFLLYFASILVAAWYGGMPGGLATTALTALLGAYFFLPPLSSVGVPDVPTTIRLLVFFAEGAVISAITTRLRATQHHAAAAQASAESTLAKLEGILKGVDEGITVQDEAGRLIYANRAAAALTGFASAEELLSAPVLDIMQRFEMLTPGGDPFPVAELPGRRTLAGLPSEERVVRFRICATGQESWALVRANALDIPGSDLRHAVNVFQDVTEARRQEAQLRVSEQWLTTTLQSIGDAVIATDEQSAVTFLNRVAEELTGWDADSARGKPLAEVFRIVNEGTRLPVESPVERVLREGTVVGLANHTVLISRKGTECSIDDSAAPIRTPQGRTVGTVLVFRDVSQRRIEERRRLFIARAAAELASSLDYEKTLATVARMAVPAVGDWCAVDMVEGGALRRLAVAHVDPEKIALVYELERRYPQDPSSAGGVYEVLRTGKPVFAPEIPEAALASAARDAEHLRLIRALELRSFIAVPLVTDARTFGVLTLAMAESGRAHAQEDLDFATALADRAALAVNHAKLYAAATEARHEAEHASRVKDEFLAMLSHELRNPLAPILTTLGLMKLRAPETFAEERALLERQVKHLVTLVDDLLDVARITQQKMELTRESVDLGDTLEKALELAGPLIEERRHEVVTELARGLLVWGDALRLAQVFTNLLTNAAKYTRPGGRIEVRGKREGEQIVIRVRDNGDGIAKAILPRVFDLFMQSDQSLDRAMGGLGLGLTLVRTVVELHGGRVTAESAGPGLGSEFAVVLPALPASLEVAAPSPSAPRAARLDPDGVGVLVVNDNEDALEVLCTALELLGFRSYAASDAAEALGLVEAVKPSFALVNIGLPVMDGYELAGKLRRTDGLERLKLVAVTGYGQQADKERARAAGFDEHLVKPISLEEVESVLARLGSAAGSSDRRGAPAREHEK